MYLLARTLKGVERMKKSGMVAIMTSVLPWISFVENEGKLFYNTKLLEGEKE